MKTIEQLKQSIEDVRRAHPDESKRTKRQQNKINRDIEYRHQCIRAIEQGMTEEKLAKQLEEVQAKLQKLEDNYQHWKSNTPLRNITNVRDYYERTKGFPDLRKQIKFLQFILF